MAALVAGWQSVQALEWNDSMTVLAASAAFVAVLFVVYIRISRNVKKDASYQEIAGDDSC